jgi:hypothetical protein
MGRAEVGDAIISAAAGHSNSLGCDPTCSPKDADKSVCSYFGYF